MKLIKLEKMKIIKNMCICCFFILLSCNKETKKVEKEQKKIEYNLGKEIETAIIKWQKSFFTVRYKTKPDKFYLIFSRLMVDHELNRMVLAYCDGCDNEILIQNTNRFSKINNTMFPIIFQSDIFFTSEIRGSNFSGLNKFRIFIEFDENKKVIEVYM